MGFIGWYCNVGYYKGEETEIKELSQITWLDKNVPFTIGFSSSISEIAERALIGSDDYNEAFALVEQYFGGFAYRLYAHNNVADRFVYIPGYDLLRQYIPSFDASWKNTFKFFSDLKAHAGYIMAIHIPTLKRCLLFNSSNYSSPRGYYTDGKTIGDYKGVCPIMYARSYKDSAIHGEVIGYVLSTDYISYDTLKDKNNYREIWFSSRSEKYQQDPKNFFFFTDTNKPDILKFFDDGDGVDFADEIPPENPYAPGGDSKPGDTPPGTFDNTSNPIPDSTLPAISAANTGFTRIYNPTLSQVQDLARYLWTDESVIQTIWNHIKQYFEDPMQAIIGFNLVPVKVPDGGFKNFALMYLDTGVAMNTAANQFVDVDCGTLELKRFYGSALDQSPFTKVSCFLPYIGTVQLNCDEVMGTTLQVKYRVDIVSGSCVAKILVDGNVLYQYSGHCAINIPISSADFSSYVAAAISVAKLAFGAAIGGVAGALSAVPEPTPQTNQTETVERTTARNVETGRQVVTGTKTTTVTETKSPKQTSTKASYSFLSPANIANTVGQVMSSKPVIQHSGSFSGNTGYLGIRRPFLIVERPNMCMPEQYQHFNGYPAMITLTLSDCKGFTRIQQVQLTGMSATNPEQAEIMGLLKSGVYM